MEDRPYLSVDDVARELDIEPATVRDWIRKKILPAHRIGNKYRIARVDLDEFMRQRRTIQEEKPNGKVA